MTYHSYTIHKPGHVMTCGVYVMFPLCFFMGLLWTGRVGAAKIRSRHCRPGHPRRRRICRRTPWPRSWADSAVAVHVGCFCWGQVVGTCRAWGKIYLYVYIYIMCLRFLEDLKVDLSWALKLLQGECIWDMTLAADLKRDRFRSQSNLKKTEMRYQNPENSWFSLRLLYIQDLIPVLEVLQNPHLRTRHWTALSQVMLDLVVKDGKPHITFGQAPITRRFDVSAPKNIKHVKNHHIWKYMTYQYT